MSDNDFSHLPPTLYRYRTYFSDAGGRRARGNRIDECASCDRTAHYLVAFLNHACIRLCTFIRARCSRSRFRTFGSRELNIVTAHPVTGSSLYDQTPSLFRYDAYVASFIQISGLLDTTTSVSSPASSVMDNTQALKSHADEPDQNSNGDGSPKEEKQSESDVEQGEPMKHQGPPAFDPRQNPDGGMQAWLCLLGGFCTLFCSFGLISVYLVLQHPFMSGRLTILSRLQVFLGYSTNGTYANYTQLSLGVGVFQAYYEAVTLREYSPSTIAWISSLMIFFMFFFGPIIGEY